MARTLGVDLAAPTVSSATIDGTSLVITFSEDLDLAATPANSAFSVVKTPAGGSEEAVSLSSTVAPSAGGREVTLTLSSAVVPSDMEIKVSYTEPGADCSNSLADGAGNGVARFADQAVENNTLNPAPVPTAAVVVGSSLTLTFNEELDSSSDGIPASSALVVTVSETESPLTEGTARFNSADFERSTNTGGAPANIALSTEPSIHGRTVDLTLAEAPASGMSVKVSYQAPVSGGRLRGIGAGTEVDSFTVQGLTFANPVAGTPVITGPNVFQVPAKLGVDLSAVTGAGDVSYRWIRVDSDGASSPVNIGTGATYTLADADADAGKRVKVEVIVAGAPGSSSTLASAAYPSSGSIEARRTCNPPNLSGGGAARLAAVLAGESPAEAILSLAS